MSFISEFWREVRRKLPGTIRVPQVIVPSVKPRPIQFEPGDYKGKNAVMIIHAMELIGKEQLWTQEAFDSTNPVRNLAAQELARQWARVRFLEVEFYSRWDIEE